MDWFNTWFSPIVSLFSQIALAGFTVVLAIATVKLHRGTSRYTTATEDLVRITQSYSEATKQMAQNTEHSTEVSRELLIAQQLKLVDVLFHRLNNANWLRQYEDVFGDKNKVEDRSKKAYRKLTDEMLGNVLRKSAQEDLK